MYNYVFHVLFFDFTYYLSTNTVAKAGSYGCPHLNSCFRSFFAIAKRVGFCFSRYFEREYIRSGIKEVNTRRFCRSGVLKFKN
nr:hypothetical protein [uncultured bacterium]